MFSLKRSSLLMLPAVLTMLVVACGDDPTPTSPPPPPPPEEPTPTPTVALADQEGVIFIEAIRYEEGLIELRIGPDPKLGYEANTILKSDEGDGWTIQLDVGDILAVGEISQSGAVPHAFTIGELGVRFPLHADEGGGAVAPWKFPFLDEGIYAIGDGHDHGTAIILVGDVELPSYLPVTYVLDEIRLRDEAIELRMGPTSYWGYDAEARVRTDEVENITITINVGDTLEFPDGFTVGGSANNSHILTIDDLGISFEIAPGQDTNLGYQITPTEPGTYPIYDAAYPELGSIAIVVNVPGVALPVTYELDEIRVRDTVFELRMGPTTAWGYAADARIRTDDGANGIREVDDITITINVGDKLVFPDGLTGSGSATETHFITIVELGIDAEIAPGADTNLGLEMAPTEAGTLRLFCSLHPEPEVHGNFFIVVQ